MKFLLTLFTLLTISASFAQDEKAQGILDKLSKKIKAQSSFYVEFTATIQNSAAGTKESESGKGWVKGNKYHASYGDNTIISNGLKTWTIVKEERSVYETDADEDDDEMMNPKKLMTIWENGFKNKYSKEVSYGSEKAHVIYLYPKKPGDVDYHTIVLYVSSESNELKKVILKMKDGTKMTYKLTKYTSNPSVEDSKFVFKKEKYPGYTVIRD